ncbi:MAG TPA: HAD family hydrolase [Candidatus Saccharimonadales bacterium]|nr:HAD family hydrolase [Candidatus Saccharimonadales bacterium]
MTEQAHGISEPGLRGLRAITFDFGNTLVPVPRDGLRRVVEETARQVIARCGPFDAATLLAVWDQERERQFAEEVPEFREVDLDQRIIRVLARMRGCPVPPAGVRWDDVAAAGYSDAAEVAWAVDVYSRAFVELIPVPPDVGPMLRRLSGRYRLALLSNWPLALTIDRFVEHAGWLPSLVAVVVSQRVGTIKPHPEIFRVAAALLDEAPEAILHIGDDWSADVVGAREAGWHAAWLRARVDSPLPSSERDGRVVADLEVDSLQDFERALARTGAPQGRPRR